MSAGGPAARAWSTHQTKTSDVWSARPRAHISRPRAGELRKRISRARHPDQGSVRGRAEAHISVRHEEVVLEKDNNQDFPRNSLSTLSNQVYIRKEANDCKIRPSPTDGRRANFTKLRVKNGDVSRPPNNGLSHRRPARDDGGGMERHTAKMLANDVLRRRSLQLCKQNAGGYPRAMRRQLRELWSQDPTAPLWHSQKASVCFTKREVTSPTPTSSLLTRRTLRFSSGVPVLVPVRASPVPSVVRGSLL